MGRIAEPTITMRQDFMNRDQIVELRIPRIWSQKTKHYRWSVFVWVVKLAFCELMGKFELIYKVQDDV